MRWNYLCLAIIFMTISCNLIDSGGDSQSNANLKAISIPGQLSPAFSPDVTDYSVTFDVYPRSFILIATTENSSATIKVNNIIAASGEEFLVQTSPPNFVVNIKVTSQNGKNTKTYVLSILDN